MKEQFPLRRLRLRRAQAGMTLIETMIAVLLILIAAATVMTMALTAVTTTENQGHLAARTAEYAQDKMEQLLSLAYCDANSNTAVFPSSPTGGTGLGGCMNPGNPVDPRVPGGTVGGLNPAAPVQGYADFLCEDGSYVGTAGCTAEKWYYMRLWQITNPPVPAGNSLKQITVRAQVRSGIASRATVPQSTVTSIKAYPF
jgi:type II secretory pathway pseudopilin PulG